MLGNVLDGSLRGHDVSLLIDPPVPLEDDLFWLRDDAREDAEVLALLKAEKAHTEAETRSIEEPGGPVDRLFEEMKSRLKETDAGVPYAEGPFLRYERTVAGKAYKLHCRVVAGQGPDAVDAAALLRTLQANASAGKDSGIDGEEVLLDENEVATELAGASAESGADNKSKEDDGNDTEESVTTCDVRTVKVSPDAALLAYSVDVSGTEVFDILFKRLAWRICVDDKSPDDKRAVQPVVHTCCTGSAALLPDRLVRTNGTHERPNTFVFGNRQSRYLLLNNTTYVSSYFLIVPHMCVQVRSYLAPTVAQSFT
jgi:protease II